MPRARFVNEREHTPPLMVRLEPTVSSRVALEPEPRELPGAEARPGGAGPTPASGAAPCTARRRDVRALLAAFTRAEARGDEESSRQPRAMPDATPPPVAVTSDQELPVPDLPAGGHSRGPVMSLARRLFWVGGAAIFGLAAVLRTGSPVPAAEGCAATLVVKAVAPGSELRLRAQGVDEPWLLRVADAPTVELGGLPCGRAHELVIRRNDGWDRFEVTAGAVAPRAGESTVRHELVLR
jgi:hypothetical protein